MRIAALWLAATLTAQAESTVEAFGQRWTVPVAKDWTVEGTGDTQVLRMLVARPSLLPRRPSQYALLEAAPFRTVSIEAEVRRDNNSLILIYAWRDKNHFNYAHLSVDEATKQPVHNGIFHVYGGDRVRISATRGPAALPTREWALVKLVYDGATGIVGVTVDGKALPALEAVDLSLDSGKVGLGSFFETAQFRNVKVTGK